MNLCTVSGTLVNVDGSVPTGATVSFALVYPTGNMPRLAGADDIAPFMTPSVTVDAGGNFSQALIGNDQITPAGTSYNVTFTVGSNKLTLNYTLTGAAVNLNALAPNGSTATPVFSPASVTISAAPVAPGNFSVPHWLGRVPVGAVIMMTSSGSIWLQSPVMFDGVNVYLVSSEANITAKVLLW